MTQIFRVVVLSKAYDAAGCLLDAAFAAALDRCELSFPAPTAQITKTVDLRTIIVMW